MSKSNKSVIVLVVIAVMFSVVAFAVPFPKNASFWIAYVAEIIAIALQVPIFKVAFGGADDLKSKFLGFPIARVGYTYLIIQTILSVMFFSMGWIPVPAWITAVVCVLVSGIMLVCSITADIARQTVQSIEQTTKADTNLMVSLRTRSSQLVNRTNDPALKKELERLAENIRYSDPVSNPEIAAQEQQLVFALTQLETAVAENSTQAFQLCRNVQMALDDRNAACKMNKRG
ncbi:MAG: hypothetical protein J5956_11825 [Ruminococcus sp.]|nr:hypothetical protein [Ruminococcus sp.]